MAFPFFLSFVAPPFLSPHVDLAFVLSFVAVPYFPVFVLRSFSGRAVALRFAFFIV